MRNALIIAIEGEKLDLYLAISEEAVSTALVIEEEKVQWAVFYVSKRLLDVILGIPSWRN